jgi:geranylgeranylglycerol-phosphate geranylgeranyltransferase
LSNIIHYIKLSRPVNVFIAGLTIFIAAGVAGSLEPLIRVLLAAISASLITIGANVINDYFDISIDSINKPHRPLAAKIISQKGALVYFFIVYSSAWIISLFLGWQMFFIASSISILLFLYSFKLKKMVLWGNLVVSFSTAMAFVYGGLAVDLVKGTWFAAGFAFLFHLGREIIKDMQDVKGDKTFGAVTFPVRYGFRSALALTSFVFVLLIMLTIIPYILNIYGLKYFLVVIFGIYPVLVFVLYKSWKYPEPNNLGIMSNVLKADMLVGLLAIYLG